MRVRRFLVSHAERGRELLERAGLAMIETDLIGCRITIGIAAITADMHRTSSGRVEHYSGVPADLSAKWQSRCGDHGRQYRASPRDTFPQGLSDDF